MTGKCGGQLGLNVLLEDLQLDKLEDWMYAWALTWNTISELEEH